MKRFNSDGIRLTDCCGAFSTFHDDTLCCKACWTEVGCGEGDGSETRPITTTELQRRLHDLWISNDASISADYRDLNDDALWAEYAWVGDLTERDMGMVRGEIEPPPVESIILIEGDTETLLLLTPQEGGGA
ncbi:hypothetical protein CMI47_02885 [Candidatus Pacearchaeota archaeon]|nr:hypothetical protein [Candidatus Pacearchaeota archaeon]